MTLCQIGWDKQALTTSKGLIELFWLDIGSIKDYFSVRHFAQILKDIITILASATVCVIIMKDDLTFSV